MSSAGSALRQAATLFGGRRRAVALGLLVAAALAAGCSRQAGDEVADVGPQGPVAVSETAGDAGVGAAVDALEPMPEAPMEAGEEAPVLPAPADWPVPGPDQAADGGTTLAKQGRREPASSGRLDRSGQSGQAEFRGRLAATIGGDGDAVGANEPAGLEWAVVDERQAQSAPAGRWLAEDAQRRLSAAALDRPAPPRQPVLADIEQGRDKDRNAGRRQAPENKEKAAAAPVTGRMARQDGRAGQEGRHGRARRDGQTPARPQASPAELARRYLARWDGVTGLQFQAPSGYWANTYIPGDPAMRLLAGRLLRAGGGQPIGPGRLAQAAHRNWQPFDPPGNAAMALYLQSDRAAIQGKTRLRLEVGLQATARQGGLRPAVNLALVLDLSALPRADSGQRFRALVAALQQAHQAGDRFSIAVAGRPGGLLVAAEDFRHGPIQLAMERLFGQPQAGDGPALDLMQALAAAGDEVRARDDPGAPLGSSMVLLATAGLAKVDTAALEAFAHRQAVEGIPLSVALLADGVDLDPIDRLVRAGQGSRRILTGPADAADLVAGELGAVSRVVARALRLRIRLAPDVRLVEVLGSRRLDLAHADRVRQAERSIDRRMARNLGIQADRGDDEEGIQVVIPSFLAGDSHLLLLDLVADRPGFIADAQLRYKDLVHLRNGVARVRLALPDGDRPPGPLQLRVLKNRLALELATATREAARLVAAGRPRLAAERVTRVRNLLTGMAALVPGWSLDSEIAADLALLNGYLSALQSGAHAGPGRRELADSLRYAAYRRLSAGP